MNQGEGSCLRRCCTIKFVCAALCTAVALHLVYTLNWYVFSVRYTTMMPVNIRREGLVPSLHGGNNSGALFDESKASTTIANSTESHALQTTAPSRTVSPNRTTVTPPPPSERAGPSRGGMDVESTLYDPGGRSWGNGSFCDSFVENTFQTPVGMCGPQMEQEHNLKCYRNPQSKVMVYCILESVFLSGPREAQSKKLDIGLLTGAGRSCPNPSLSAVAKTSEKNSRARTMLKSVTQIGSKPSTVCEEWINKTVFLYTADQKVHIYFRMNAYYNLHKALSREGVAPGDFVIIKHPNSSTYLFSDWERMKLFPGMVYANELPNKTVCLRKLVIVPYSFSGIPFRCKMESNVRWQCFNCHGRRLYGSSFYSFRHRVISSCGLVDEKKSHAGNSIAIVSRTPYKRWRKDNPSKFQRVLTNEKELVKALRDNFPETNVTVAHMEKMDICEQIHMAHNADVLMGVHGAGLVHLWWLQEDALAVELNPKFEIGNPSFRMLATLSGRNYASVPVSGTQHFVSVNVHSVVDLLKSKTQLS